MNMAFNVYIYHGTSNPKQLICVNTHRGEKPYECTLCGKDFPSDLFLKSKCLGLTKTNGILIYYSLNLLIMRIILFIDENIDLTPVFYRRKILEIIILWFRQHYLMIWNQPIGWTLTCLYFSNTIWNIFDLFEVQPFFQMNLWKYSYC